MKSTCCEHWRSGTRQAIVPLVALTTRPCPSVCLASRWVGVGGQGLPCGPDQGAAGRAPGPGQAALLLLHLLRPAQQPAAVAPALWTRRGPGGDIRRRGRAAVQQQPPPCRPRCRALAAVHVATAPARAGSGGHGAARLQQRHEQAAAGQRRRRRRRAAGGQEQASQGPSWGGDSSALRPAPPWQQGGQAAGRSRGCRGPA